MRLLSAATRRKKSVAVTRPNQVKCQVNLLSLVIEVWRMLGLVLVSRDGRQGKDVGRRQLRICNRSMFKTRKINPAILEM